MSLQIGQLLEGKFRVEHVLGEGAMGLVVEATHLDLEERVALKFLRDEARARPDLAARFTREARALAMIKNDHVARVYDVGTHEGAPFIVMEYLVGRDLEQLLEAGGRLDVAQAAEYVIQACDGLTAAHVQGIVHRDIKPGNLFVDEHGGIRQVKVLDFGISKADLTKGSLEDASLLAGTTTQIMGSPHYMSPEQIRSTKDVDLRADIWSLGVVLFELVTGQPPFNATEVTAIIAQVLHEPHRPARALVPELPAGLEAVIDRCLQKDASKRYACAADLAEALLPFAPKRARAVAERARDVQARASGERAAPSLPPPPYAPSAAPVPAPRPVAEPRPRALAALALLAALAGLAGGGYATFTWLRARPPEVAPDVRTETTAAPQAPSAPPVATEQRPPPASSPSVAPSEAPAEPADATPTVAAPAAPRAAAGPPVAAPHARPAPRPRPQTSSSAPTPNPDSEIRHER